MLAIKGVRSVLHAWLVAAVLAATRTGAVAETGVITSDETAAQPAATVDAGRFFQRRFSVLVGYGKKSGLQCLHVPTGKRWILRYVFGETFRLTDGNAAKVALSTELTTTGPSEPQGWHSLKLDQQESVEQDLRYVANQSLLAAADSGENACEVGVWVYLRDVPPGLPVVFSGTITGYLVDKP